MATLQNRHPARDYMVLTADFLAQNGIELLKLLAVIMLFGFVLGIVAVIAGGFANRRGDVDTGKLSIIGRAVIAAAPAVAYAFLKIFGREPIRRWVRAVSDRRSISFKTNNRRIMKSDLRLTDTNDASDSKGRTWGLEGNLVGYLIRHLEAHPMEGFFRSGGLRL